MNWFGGLDSALQMKTIDEIYRKSGMPIRPTNLFALETQRGKCQRISSLGVLE